MSESWNAVFMQLYVSAKRPYSEYRYVHVCVNSSSDAYNSCKNFVNFGPVIPESTGLICDCLVYKANIGVSS